MTTRTKKTTFTIGGLALLALAIAGGIWFYPEFRRYVHIERM